MLSAIRAHDVLLMRFEHDFAQWPRRAQENEALPAILFQIRLRSRIVHRAAQEPRGASETAPLVANGG